MNPVNRVTANPAAGLNRRSFLKRCMVPTAVFALPFLATGCRAVESRDKTPMDPWVNLLDATFGVAESHFVGEKVAVIFADAHHPMVIRANIERIVWADDAFDLQSVGVENYVSGPDSPDEEKIRQTVSNLFGMRSNIGMIQNLLGYGALFNRHEFQTFGIEEPGVYLKAQMVTTLMQLYLMMTAVIQKEIVLEKDGYPKGTLFEFGYVGSIHRGQKALADLGVEVPQFDFSLFPQLTRTDDIDLSKASGAGLAHLQFLMNRMAQKAFAVLGSDRNRYSAEKIAQHMRENSFKRVGILIGAAHLDRNLSAPTLQSELIRRGISVIVVKLPRGLPEENLKNLSDHLKNS